MSEKTTPTAEKKRSPSEVSEEILSSVVNSFLDAYTVGAGDWDSGHTQLPMNRLRPINYATGKEYSGINAARLGLASRFASNEWIGFGQLKSLRISLAAKGVSEDQLPYIRKGEKATHGITVKEFKSSETKTNKETGEEEDREWVDRQVSSFAVFNIEQIDNFPRREQAAAPNRVHEPTAALQQCIDALAAKTGLKVIFGSSNGNFYRPSTDEIHLVAPELFKSQQDMDGTTGHEIGHCLAAAHRNNEADALQNKFGDKAYAAEERRAESFSILLALDLGIVPSEDHLRNHAAYIDHWAEDKKNPLALVSAFSAADKRVNLLRTIVHEYCFERDFEPMIPAPRATLNRFAGLVNESASKLAREAAPEPVQAPKSKARTKRPAAALEMAL